MKEITVAENAGFCFGVKRATDRLEEALRNATAGERIYTLGHLIHNETYNESLRRRGVDAIDTADVERVAAEASAECPVTLLVRAHGIPKQTEQMLRLFSEKNAYFRWIDCTCPYVKKIHRIAAENSSDESFFILMGAANHPEVVGIMSYFDGEKYVAATPEQIEEVFLHRDNDKMHKKTPVMAAQTTFNLVNWHQSQKISKNSVQMP